MKLPGVTTTLAVFKHNHTARSPRKQLVFFFLSLLFALAILFLRIYFSPFFGGNKNTYIIFYPAVMLCALAGGFMTGITATLVFAFGAAYFLLAPLGSFSMGDPYDFLGFSIFTLVGVLISITCELLRTAQTRANQQAEQLHTVSEELLKAKNQLQTILENVADGIIVRDGKGKPVYANPTALRLYGFSEAKRRKFLTLEEMERNYQILDESGQTLSSADMPSGKVLSGARQAEDILCFRHKKTKKEFWCIARARGIYNKRGELVLTVIIFADITQRRRLEQQKDEFIGIASHELKTPLMSIKGYVQILERTIAEVGNDQTMTLIEKTNRYIDKLNNLIKDLLDVSKIQSGKLEFNFEQFDLNGLINESINSMSAIAPHYQIRCEKCPDLKIMADRNRLEQVFTNLLSNAIKYSPNGKKITVRAVKENGLVHVTVTDFGIGIPKDQQDKLFKRFYRVDSSAKRFSGMGIGLYVSHEIVTRHGGKMWVESEEGQGSTFHFTLPIQRKQ